MTTWAKFFFYAGQWHFQGFTSHEAAVAEFEEFCVNEGVISVVLALQHPDVRKPYRLADIELPRGRHAEDVRLEGDAL